MPNDRNFATSCVNACTARTDPTNLADYNEPCVPSPCARGRAFVNTRTSKIGAPVTSVCLTDGRDSFVLFFLSLSGSCRRRALHAHASHDGVGLCAIRSSCPLLHDMRMRVPLQATQRRGRSLNERELRGETSLDGRSVSASSLVS